MNTPNSNLRPPGAPTFCQWRRLILVVAWSAWISVALATPPTQANSSPALTHWDKLLPAGEGDEAATDPGVIHGYLGESAPAAKQTGSAKTNPALDGVSVKIPGYIVPLNVGKGGRISEFFLVPYLGACIHVPPPPPNQIVYVTPAVPIKVSSIDDVFWITGILRTSHKETRMASAAYTLAATRVDPYN